MILHSSGWRDQGATCAARTQARWSVALLTPGPRQGLAAAVELAPGRLLRIQFYDTPNAGSGCLFARSMVVEALGKLLDKTA